MISSKKQEYTYSLKMASYTNGIPIFEDKILFYLLPPQDSIAIKRLRTNIKIQFDVAVASADRIIEKVGIISEFVYDETTAAYFKSIDVNAAADASRIAEVELDITSLLDQSNTRYDNSLPVLETYTNFTFIWLKIGRDSNLENASFNAIIKRWKADGLFVTTGIK